MTRTISTYLYLTLMMALTSATAPAVAQVQRELGQLEGVGVTEHLNADLPLRASFRNDAGKNVTLGDYFQGQRPVILSLNYSDCPMLCGLQLNGLIDSLGEIDLQPGEDFDIVSVSIDPLESPIRARQSKQRFLRRYEGSGRGWHFLVGDQENIKRLAESVGFGYRYVPERKEYAHAAVFMVCTPDGRISRYIYGVDFPPRTVRLSLVEAAEGKIGTTIDQVLLFCFQYDAAKGSYAPTAIGLMKLAGGATVLILAAALIPTWLRRRRPRSDASTSRDVPAEEHPQSPRKEQPNDSSTR